LSEILVIARGADLHAWGVVDALRRRGVQTHWVDLGDLEAGTRLTLELAGRPNGGVRTADGRLIALDEIDTIWWRRPRRPDFPDGLGSDEVEFVRGEWEHFLLGIEAFGETRWVNPPLAERRASVKSLQLVKARDAGLRVPLTTLTNDPDQVRELAERHGPLIYKRIGPALRPVTATMELTPADLDRLETLPNCPAIFQERIEARSDIRVTAIGDALYAAEIDSQNGSSPLDWRYDHTVEFRPHELDAGTAQRLRELLAEFRLAYAAIDLRLTPEGEYVFLRSTRAVNICSSSCSRESTSRNGLRTFLPLRMRRAEESPGSRSSLPSVRRACLDGPDRAVP
jgi:hypothetical protein